LEEKTGELAAGLASAAAAAECPVAIARLGPLLTVFFWPEQPVDAAEALSSDRGAYGRFFGSMLDQGVLLPPSQFEAWFPSMAHDASEIEATVAVARSAFEASLA